MPMPPIGQNSNVEQQEQDDNDVYYEEQHQQQPVENDYYNNPMENDYYNPMENPILDYCLEEAEYIFNPFWFISGDVFTVEEIEQRCEVTTKTTTTTTTPTTDTSGGWGDNNDNLSTRYVENLHIMCDWTNNEEDSFRGKGRAYRSVEETCNEKGGLMYAAHFLKIVHKYEHSPPSYGTAAVDVIETSEHYNVPVCLPPSCDPEEIFHEIVPCKQKFDQWFPFYAYGKETWAYEEAEEGSSSSTCETDFILAATYMDEECETKLTYMYMDEDDISCHGSYTDGHYTCDFSDYSEEDGIMYDPDLCDDNADQFKYSYGLKGRFDLSGMMDDHHDDTTILASHYYLNTPTCLKEECDAESYFYKNLVPFHSNKWFKEERENEKIIKTTGMGILAVKEG